MLEPSSRPLSQPPVKTNDKLSFYDELCALRRYLEIVCERANKEIEARFKNKTREIVRGGITAVLGFLFAWYLQGREQMKANVIEWLAFGVCVGLCLWLIEVLWDCVRSLRLVYQDLVNENKRLTGKQAELSSQLTPQLKILYEPKKPFLETSSSTRIITYRVGVLSQILVSDVVLTANVTVGGRERTNVHLRSDQDDGRGLKRVKLYPGKPDYWQVVTKGDPRAGDVHLQHIAPFPKDLSLPQEFEVTASGGESRPATMIVSVNLDANQNLTFEVRDPPASTSD